MRDQEVVRAGHRPFHVATEQLSGGFKADCFHDAGFPSRGAKIFAVRLDQGNCRAAGLSTAEGLILAYGLRNKHRFCGPRQ